MRPGPAAGQALHKVQVIDAGTLQSGATIITLDGIVARDAKPNARSARQRLGVRFGRPRRPDQTDPLARRQLHAAKEGEQKAVAAPCSVAGTDLATLGRAPRLGEPEDTQEQELAEAETAARKDKIGMWRGASREDANRSASRMDSPLPSDQGASKPRYRCGIVGASGRPMPRTRSNRPPQCTCKTHRRRRYSKAGGRVHRAYREAVKRLKDDPDALAALKDAQRAWIGFRDAKCDYWEKRCASGTFASVAAGNCMRVTTTSAHSRCAQSSTIWTISSEREGGTSRQPDPRPCKCNEAERDGGKQLAQAGAVSGAFTSSVTTLNDTSACGPNEVVMATSVASRPRAIKCGRCGFVVARIERVPAVADISLEPRAEIHRRRVGGTPISPR